MRCISRAKPSVLFVLCVLCLASRLGAAQWRTTEGASLEGDIVGMERGALAIRPATGTSIVRVPLENLDESSREAAENWAKDKLPADRLPPSVWPDRTPTVSGSIAEEKRPGAWIFRTPHYEFRSDAPLTAAAIGEFARIAETTVARVNALPLRMPPIGKDGLYTALLFRDRAGYANAGGNSNSAGQFIGGGRWNGYLIVPFESPGIREFAGGYSKSAEFDSHVLIHEIGHQLTARYIPFMPAWLNEGLAEYIALPRYSAAGFASSPRDLVGAIRARQDHYRSLRRAFEKASGPFEDRIEFRPTPLRDLLKPGEIDRILSSGDLRKTHESYYTSMVLTFFLLHFDGDGQGRRLRAYFETLGDTVEFLQSRGANGRLPDGVVYDESLTLETLRSALDPMLPAPSEADALQRQITESFAQSGLKLEFP